MSFADIVTCKTITSLMILLIFFIHHMLRVNISIAIIKMIRTNNSFPENDGPQFEWGQEAKNNILGVFYFGYALTQVPGGRLAEMFGSRIVIGTGLLLASLSTILTPAASCCHYYWLLVARFFIGLGLGVQWPATLPVATRWIPKTQTSYFLSHMMISSLGAAATLPVCGYLIANLGWESVFYVTGTISLLCTLAWWFLVYDSPKQHPRITQKEKDFLCQKLEGNIVCTRRIKTPWREILTSRPVWALNVCAFAYGLVLFLFMNHLPTYLNDVLHFNIKQNGWLSSSPHLLRYFLSVGTSYAVDEIIKTRKFSTIAIRRTCFFFLLFVNSFILSIQAIWGFDPLVSIINFNICLSFIGFVTTAHFSNCLDLSPTYSGTIFGVNQIFISAAGYGATRLVNVFTKESQNFQEWSYVFWVSAGVSFVGFVVFMGFGSAEEQEWSPKSIDHAEEQVLQLK